MLYHTFYFFVTNFVHVILISFQINLFQIYFNLNFISMKYAILFIIFRHNIGFDTKTFYQQFQLHVPYSLYSILSYIVKEAFVKRFYYIYRVSVTPIGVFF